MYDVLIVGCGIVGSAVAYELSKYRLSCAVVERYNDVANGATKANSAILHAGFDPKPGTLMARLNVKGIKLAKEICEKLDVERREIPSFVLAFDDADMETLSRLYDQGVKNGVNVELMTGDEALALEPHLSPDIRGALYSPDSAIVNPWDYALAMAEVAARNGVEILLENKVTDIKKDPKDGHFTVTTDKGKYDARYVVNAAGCFAPEINAMVGDTTLEAKNMCGQYFVFDKAEGVRINSVVFTCPNEKGKGVLVSPTVHGNLIVGPDAFEVPDGDCVATDPNTINDLRANGVHSVPSINFRDVIHEYAGVRPNTQFDEFFIKELPSCPGFVALAGIKSPGLSAAPAIALEALSILKDAGLGLEKKENYVDERRVLRFNKLSEEEKRRVVKENPLYGRIICRCETVTEGEIVDAIHRPIVPRTIDAIKRRCSAGMGRCQGGFCSPRVHEILARELNVSPVDILMDEQGSYILVGRTKEANAQ